MTVGLFIPCYIDQFYPQVGMATVKLLEKFGIDFEYPFEQTCCGQPMANSGCTSDAKKVAEKFYNEFINYDQIICPSGSCVAMIKHQYPHLLPDKDIKPLSEKTYELVEFLTEISEINQLEVSYPHKVGIHQSCHGLRELKLASATELRIDSYNKVETLLKKVKDIEIISLDRSDECCGFGGMFSTYEEAISCSMGNDRIQDHLKHQATIITGVDMSCLMHLEGLIKRQKSPLQVKHIAEILVGEQ
ncbi:MAG: Fe-S oxidoreductase [Planctomycetota bacterium]|nr:MAG: Fe-S oxidoreductase [Planctomycetota bacterium]